ncbi:kinase domain protein, partial (macronuclear) [Tetrahymena thermophila SB210]
MDQIQNYQMLGYNQNELFIMKHYNQKCNLHNQRLDILKVDNYSNQQMLKCIYCLSEQTFKFLPLKQVLDSNQSTLFKGWPILDDTEIYEQLMVIPKKEELIKQSIQNVQVFYKLLRDEINLLIDKKEKDSLINIEMRYDSFEYPWDLYNRICQKEKLKDIILNQYQDFINQNQAFSLIVKENIEKQKVYKEQMLNSLRTIQSYKVDLVSQNQIKDLIVQLINQINDFSIAQENRNMLQVSQNSQVQGNQLDQNKKIQIFSLEDLSNIQNFQNIEIYLSNKNIQDEQLKQIAGALEKCQNISSLILNLSENNFKLEGVQYIATSLQKCHQINSLELYLNNNNLKLEGAKYIATSLEKLHKMNSLKLYL